MRVPFALVVVAVALAVGIVGFNVNPYFAFVLTRILIFIILAMGLNILMGYAGQLVFAHAALFGVGAYTTGLLQVRLGLDFPVSALMGTLAATAIGSVLVLPALRLSGIYLAISTLAVAQAIQWTFLNWVSVTYGPGGFRAPSIDLGFGLAKHESIFVLTLVVTAVLLILKDNMVRSGMGRRLVAIRANPLVASAMGVNVTMVKTKAFALSAAFAGVAGALFSALLGFVSPESFNLDQMVLMQIMVVLGGLGSLLGAIIGPIIVVLSVEVLRDTRGLLEILFGTVLIVFVLFCPQGVAGIISRILRYKEEFIPPGLSDSARKDA
jgi:branched-chain amino acid transport system permease protein